MAEKFAPVGFQESAAYACYGLAEATLFVSGPARGSGATVERFDAGALAMNHARAAEDGRALVGCGTASSEHVIAVVDPQSGGTGERVPAGVVGEILVRGPSVTGGYWKQPEATRESFVERADGVYLRTGDLGFEHGGELFITGRLKDMMIVRGHNLYPQDIEQTLGDEIDVLRKGRISVFAVSEIGNASGEGIGVAAELSRSTQKLVAPEVLCRAMSEAVAEAHGEPAALILLLNPGTLPLTSSGKLRRSSCLTAWRAKTIEPFAVWERGALRGAGTPEVSTVSTGSTVSTSVPAGGTDTLARLAAIWREVLGVASAGADDTIFALGGSSLSCMQVAARVTGELGVELDPQSLFQAPSLRALALEIDRRAAHGRGGGDGAADGAADGAVNGAAGGSDGGRIVAVARTEGLPLSPGELRLWFLHQLDPASTAYTLIGSLRIHGRLDPAALAQAFTQLVARHEILRTRFTEREGRPHREIDLAWQVPVATLDLRRRATGVATGSANDLATGLATDVTNDLANGQASSLATGAADGQASSLVTGAANGQASREADGLVDGELGRLVDEEARQPFRLADGRLLRATLVALGDAEHVLIVACHHIVADGWSMDILRRELFALYGAAVSGARAALATLPIQVADHAAWHGRWLGSAAYARQLAYWRDALAGEPTPLVLPRAGALRGEPGRRDGQLAFRVEPALAGQLRALADDSQVTLFMVLLGALQVVLHRYGGQDDLWIGTPVANRRAPEVQGLIGFFVNTVVLRTQVAPRDSFRAHLARVKDVVTGALANAEVPFQKVVELVNPERSLEQQALFQVMYNHLRPEYATPIACAGLEIDRAERAGHAADFDLVLDTSEDAAGIHGVWSYRADRFDRETIERLAGHYAAVLAAIVLDPLAPVHRVPMLGEAERDVLARGGARAAEIDAELRGLRDLRVHEAFERCAARTPAAIAVRWGGAAMDYATLDARASWWARRLRQLGVGPDVLVGLCAEPSFELVVGMLAVLKAGGAYLPLEPSDPPARLAFMLRDARPPVVLVQGHLRGLIGESDGAVLGFDDEPAMVEVSDLGDARLASVVQPDHLAYCIYTSGSSGMPKGTLLRHGSLSNHLAWMGRTFGAEAAARVLQLAPASFDASVCELWLPLTTGGTCVLAARDVARDPDALLRQVARDDITLLQTVPSLLALLVEAPGGAAMLGRLRCLVSGGEALPAALRDRVLELPEVAAFNLYGPTETTIDATGARIAAADRGQPVSIGGPIANATAYVLDRFGGLVPIGGAGELYVGGAGLARGYLNRPGSDGRALRARSVQRRGRRAVVPHRRSGALARRGRARVPRSRRRAGQAARASHRAGRDRGAAAERAGGPAGDRGGARGGARQAAAGGVRRARGAVGRGGAGAARGAAGAARAGLAGLHGASGVRVLAGVAGDRERQARSRGAAGAGSARGAGRVRGAAQRRGARARGDLGPGAGASAGGHPRQLLPAGRGLDHGDPGGGQGARRGPGAEPG